MTLFYCKALLSTGWAAPS